MRREALLLAWLPAANALSLANFQDITSVLIPLSCQFSYDQQIPNCVVADFGDAGCSAICTKSLTTLASSVTNSCSNVDVNSNTLLGIIKGGGILQALCQTMQQPTTTKSVQTSATAQEASVTLPTASPGVVLSTTSSTSSASNAKKTTTANAKTTSTSSTKESSSATESSAAAETTVQSTDSGSGGAAATQSATSTVKTASSTTKGSSAATTAANQKSSGSEQTDTGGGSPFDISSDGSRMGTRSILAVAAAAFAGLLLVR